MRLPGLIIAVLMLSACGLSPQMIQIHPELTRVSENQGQNRPIRLAVVDERENAAFGTRGGVYKDTALIRPANDLVAEVADAVRQALQERGYNAYNPGENATGLTVRLKTLDYVPESGSVVNRVEVSAELEALAENRQGDSYLGSYRTGNTYEQPLTPSAARNEMMINEVLQRALDKLLADPDLHAFLGSAPEGAGN